MYNDNFHLMMKRIHHCRSFQRANIRSMSQMFQLSMHMNLPLCGDFIVSF